MLEARCDSVYSLREIAADNMATGGATLRFAEDVAVNRGFPVKVFPTVAAAEEWLLSRPAADTQNPHR